MRIGRGPRAVEALLLDELDALIEAGLSEPERLAEPVRVVVPSRSLREQLAAALVRRRGRALAGVEVQTLHALALEVLERAGVEPPPSDALFPVLVRKIAREDAFLRAELDGLVDGYGPVVGVVADLLDAGFEGAASEALDDALGEPGARGREVERALALLRVAGRVAALLDEAGIGHRSQLLARAHAELLRDPPRVLPARAVLVHGFAEATGRGSDLLEALVRYADARVFLDEPADPAEPGRPDAGVRFLRRLHERLAGAAATCDEVAAADPPQLEAFEAPGAHAEVREVGERIRSRIAAGVVPEAIAVVARDLGAYRAALRRHFGRLGIPFSGLGESGSAVPAARRAAALLELLERGGRCACDRWLDAALRLGSGPDAPLPSAELRLALRRMGVRRLHDASEVAPHAQGVALPGVGGWRGDDGQGGGGVTRLRVASALLERVLGAAGELARRVEALAGDAAIAERLAALGSLLRETLGWRDDRDECRPLLEALDALGSELPPAWRCSAGDFVILLRGAFERVGFDALGGAGGGVQVLSAMEARARTFEELFVVGLNRDVFPRTVGEDPLLADRLRTRLAVVLPDLPVKATGHDEERYLFAQLVAASGRVTLSWQTCDDDGRPRVPSSFIERLGWGSGGRPLARVPSCAGRDPERAPPDEAVLATGLRSGRSSFAAAFRGAVAELGRAPGIELPVAPEALARARLAVLDELDGRGEAFNALGPYLGVVGPPAAAASDPRRRGAYVTTVEDVARCGWQAFLVRLLRVEAAADPLQELPGVDARLVGSAVHGVLTALARDAVGPAPPGARLADVRDRAPARLGWPDAEGLESLARQAACEVLREEGVALPGLERALALRALPYLARAHELDAAAPPGVGVLAAEIEGAASVGPARHELRFRVDRVDADDAAPERRLRLTDYKTGAPLSAAVKPQTRRTHLLRDVAAGRNLQAAAYAAGGGEGAEGRFVYLDPDVEPDRAVVCVPADDEEIRQTFEAVLDAVLGAWTAGALPPRLVDPGLDKEPEACARCEVASACLRGDSAARQRLEGCIRGLRARPPRGRLERALLGLWELGGRPASPGSGSRRP